MNRAQALIAGKGAVEALISMTNDNGTIMGNCQKCAYNASNGYKGRCEGRHEEGMRKHLEEEV